MKTKLSIIHWDCLVLRQEIHQWIQQELAVHSMTLRHTSNWRDVRHLLLLRNKANVRSYQTYHFSPKSWFGKWQYTWWENQLVNSRSIVNGDLLNWDSFQCHLYKEIYIHSQVTSRVSVRVNRKPCCNPNASHLRNTVLQ